MSLSKITKIAEIQEYILLNDNLYKKNIIGEELYLKTNDKLHKKLKSLQSVL